MTILQNDSFRGRTRSLNKWRNAAKQKKWSKSTCLRNAFSKRQVRAPKCPPMHGPYRYCAWAVLCLHSLDIPGSLSSSSFNTIEPKWLQLISIQLTIRLYIDTRVYNFATLVIFYTLKLRTKANVYHVPDLQSPVCFPNYHAGKKIVSQPEYQWTMSSHILTGRPKWYLHTAQHL